MIPTDDAYARLRAAADEAERVLASLDDQPLSERMEAALGVHIARRAMTSAANRPAHRSAVAEALADLIPSDVEPGSDA
jgi:hypothetical protein